MHGHDLAAALDSSGELLHPRRRAPPGGRTAKSASSRPIQFGFAARACFMAGKDSRPGHSALFRVALFATPARPFYSR